MSSRKNLVFCATTALFLPFVKSDTDSDTSSNGDTPTYYYHSRPGGLFAIWLLIFSALVICSCCRRLFRFTGKYADQNRQAGHMYVSSTVSQPGIITSQQPFYLAPPNNYYNYNPGFVQSSDASAFPHPPDTHYKSPINDAPPSYNEAVGASHHTHVPIDVPVGASHGAAPSFHHV